MEAVFPQGKQSNREAEKSYPFFDLLLEIT